MRNQRPHFHLRRTRDPHLPFAMALILTASGVSGGCGPPEPPPARTPVQGEAFALVREHFTPLFPTVALQEPPVRWWTTPCPGTTRSAVVLGERCYAGLLMRPDAVDVAWRGTIGESAYSHELMHFFLQRHQNDSDPLHERTSAWEVVQQADTLMQSRGL